MRLVSQYAAADVPFYVFEDDIGGRRHTVGSYGAVDAWTDNEKAKAKAIIVTATTSVPLLLQPAAVVIATHAAPRSPTPPEISSTRSKTPTRR